MGKPMLPSTSEAPSDIRRHRSKIVLLPFISVFSLYLLLQSFQRIDWSQPWHALGRPVPKVESKGPFAWDQLETKPYLDYSDCYLGFQCARLEVPLDYWNGTTNATISLAVMRLPASVDVTDKSYGGAVLLNPGGPGGSGVYFLMGAARGIRSVVDSPLSKDGKYFDLISFDPRGVGFTGPTVRCFENTHLDELWTYRMQSEGDLESSDAALGRLWSMSTAYSASCSLPVENSTLNPREYVSTASVARDMLSIVEAHGAWREKEAYRIVEKNVETRRQSTPGSIPKRGQIAESLRYKRDEEKIQYWGFSYGTYLGNTFSAMFPDRVHRLIVDGVVDAYDYTKALWFDNLVDTEKDLDLFYYHCARVGYPKCALANETGNTTAIGVRDKVQNITLSLLHNPLPIIGRNPSIITYSDVRRIIFGMLYSPVQSSEFVATILKHIGDGDIDFFSRARGSSHALDTSATAGTEAGVFVRQSLTDIDRKIRRGVGPDAQMAIACSDGDDQSYVDKAAFIKYWKSLEKISPSSGSIWAMLRLHCIHYSLRPKYRWPGPWEGNTSHPILLIGNTADPVTPGRYAVKMSKGYPNSVALLQDSPGHCSLAAFSVCTTTYIRDYFRTGKLPLPNTTCPVDVIPFGKSHDCTDSLCVQQEQQLQDEATLHQSIMQSLISSGGGMFGEYVE